MMKYKVGDVVFLKGEVTNTDEGSTLEVEVKLDGEHFSAWYEGEKVFPFSQKGYEDGLNDAWELARNIILPSEKGGMEKGIVRSACHVDSYLDAFELTPQEVLARLKAHEEKHEIKVGDVVKNYNLGRCIVLEKRNDGLFNVLTESGEVKVGWHHDVMHKTGERVNLESLWAKKREVQHEQID